MALSPPLTSTFFLLLTTIMVTITFIITIIITNQLIHPTIYIKHTSLPLSSFASLLSLIHVSVYLSICPPIYLSIYLSIHLPIHLPIHQSNIPRAIRFSPIALSPPLTSTRIASSHRSAHFGFFSRAFSRIERAFVT